MLRNHYKTGIVGRNYQLGFNIEILADQNYC